MEARVSLLFQLLLITTSDDFVRYFLCHCSQAHLRITDIAQSTRFTSQIDQWNRLSVSSTYCRGVGSIRAVCAFSTLFVVFFHFAFLFFFSVPAVSIVIWSSQLRRMKLITPMEEKTLDKIFQYNPLLFDLLLKRSAQSKFSRLSFSLLASFILTSTCLSHMFVFLFAPSFF